MNFEFLPPALPSRLLAVLSDLSMDDEAALDRLKIEGRKARIKVVRIPAAYNSNSRLTARMSESGPNELSFELLSGRR